MLLVLDLSSWSSVSGEAIMVEVDVEGGVGKRRGLQWSKWLQDINNQITEKTSIAFQRYNGIWIELKTCSRLQCPCLSLERLISFNKGYLLLQLSHVGWQLRMSLFFSHLGSNKRKYTGHFFTVPWNPIMIMDPIIWRQLLCWLWPLQWDSNFFISFRCRSVSKHPFWKTNLQPRFLSRPQTHDIWGNFKQAR